MADAVEHEAERVAALRALGVLDTPGEEQFEAVCRTARRLFDVPHVLVNLIDADRQWTKTACSLAPRSNPRDSSFCDHTIRDDAVLVVPDAGADPRFEHLPLVAGPERVSFYAGAPLILRPGVRVGALCLLDTRARDFSPADAEALQDLATVVVSHLRLSEANARVGREVAALQASEAALARSEARYEGLAQTLPLMVWTTRAQNDAVTFANSCFRRFCGSDCAHHGDWLARVHADDRTAVEDAWRAMRRSGQTLAVEARLTDGSGATRWHRIVALPVPQPDGSPPAEWLGTALDIDDIATARDALASTTNLLHIALESARAGPWDWDMRAGVTTLAPESVRIYGLPEEGERRFTTAEWTQLLHPDDREATWRAVQQAVETHTAFQADYRVVVAGNERWMRATGRTFYDADDRPYRMTGLHFDVTERKRVEAALEEATAQAESANAAKSEFLAAMSHEIRTPLNSILGYAELMLDTPHHRPDDRRYLELVRSAGSALLTVVNDVLDFSTIEAGRLELDPAAFPLRRLIDDAVAIVSGTILKRHLVVTCELDPDVPETVVADEARLKQVLLNLLNNAVKFTPAGSVTLRVRCTQPGEGLGEGQEAQEAPGTLRFEIVDTGIGIAADDLHRLFRRFTQVDGSIRRRFGGTGLGLAICHKLVAKMGGRIGVASEVGTGSTFWFTLHPGSCQPDPRDLAPAEPDGDAAGPRGERRAPRLLLAEDVPINQDLARAVLEAGGYHIDVVANGMDAIAAILAKAGAPDAYDLVLMDVQMPVMDGVTATRQLRALDACAADIPVIAMTANVMPDQIAGLHAAGMDDHVGKPFKRHELYATIERWVDRRSSHAAPN